MQSTEESIISKQGGREKSPYLRPATFPLRRRAVLLRGRALEALMAVVTLLRRVWKRPARRHGKVVGSYERA